MASPDFGLVDIVRDYLTADTLTRRLFARFRAGQLRFDEVHELVGDGEGSVLYRLKEHCHGLFRPGDRSASLTRPRESLFDLAVGSLFHEAMKFRENLYQQTVYGPKVRALRSETGAAAEETEEIFREFEKILSAVEVRLQEALQETEALFVHTRKQFRMLLAAHHENGLLARYLIENAPLVAEIFPEGLDALLAGIHGSAARGFAIAARSYLASGYFGPARGALAEAVARSGEEQDLQRLSSYAEAMDAYLEGRYGDSIEGLGRWLSLGPGADEAGLADLAHSALSRVGSLAEGPDAAELGAAAGALAARVHAAGSGARDGAG